MGGFPIGFKILRLNRITKAPIMERLGRVALNLVSGLGGVYGERVS